MLSVANCMSTARESKMCESLQKGFADCIATLLLGETCCGILVTLCTVFDEQTLVSDLKKTCRALTAGSRQKLRRDWRNKVKTQEGPLKRAAQIIRDNDPAYRPDLDIIDAIGHVPMAVRDSIDDESSVIVGKKEVSNIRRSKEAVGSQPNPRKLSVRSKWRRKL